MKNLINKAKQFSILILAIFLVGCTDDETLRPQVVAGFTYTINPNTGTVTFINISENSSKYVWDFGDDTSSTEINPIKTYVTGTYTITLKALNASGASDTFEDMIAINIPLPMILPITFDNQNVNYNANSFNGASFEVVDNPDTSGSNTSATKVGAVTNSGAQYEGIYFGLGAPINLTTLKSLSMNFWSDSPLDVLVKLEDGTAAAIETIASHGGTGWENLIFNFNSSNNYSRLTIFVDGPGTTSGTFYLDDIMQIETPIICTTETAESLSAANLNITFMSDNLSVIEDGATFERILNPDFNNSTNPSCYVGKITKLGNNPWDNNQIDLSAKLDFNTHTGLKIKVWSGRANTEVRIKLEEIGNSGNNTEKFLTTSVTNAWEELSFPFASNQSNKFNKIVIFFDLNANNKDTYYFDDLMLYGTGSGGGGGSFDDGLLTNGDFESGLTSWIGNAFNIQTEGGNSFNFANVTAAGNPYDVNLSQVVAITQGKNYKLSFEASSDRTRTMLAGIGLNEAPWTNTTQTVNLTTTTQTFTFNLSSATFGGANSRVLFDMGAAVGVVVIDKVSLFCLDCSGGGGGGGGTAGNLAVNGDFETGTDSGWIRFQNGGTAVLDNSTSNGGSWSGKLSTNGPSNPAFKQERIGAGTVAAGKTVTIKFDHKGSVGGEGGVFNVLLFGEGAGGAVPFTHVFSPAPILGGTWSTFTGTFTIPAVDVSEGISFLIETVCGGAAGCSVTANIDNVSVTLN